MLGAKPAPATSPDLPPFALQPLGRRLPAPRRSGRARPERLSRLWLFAETALCFGHAGGEGSLARARAGAGGVRAPFRAGADGRAVGRRRPAAAAPRARGDVF